MKIKIDKELCIGCELCVQIAGDVFGMDDEDKAEIIGKVTEDNKDDVNDAIESCPTEAIIKES
ncbi:MAG: ferredoxin [Elusimicrobia bacterium]|jgi:ferredoxin|nr:ferredoxin [Elusimicrobiota bacterium]